LKYIIENIIVSLVLVFLAACSSNPIKPSSAVNNLSVLKSHPIKLKPSEYHKSCQFLFAKNKKAATEKKIWACLVETQSGAYPQLIDLLLSYKPALQKDQLETIVEFLPSKKEAIEDSQLIKKLIDAGAPTANVNINNMLIMKANVCDAVELLIKNNINKFQDSHKSLNNYRSQHLHGLTSINRGYQSCPNSIRLLADFNPKLLDVQGYQGMTPLNHYLIGVDNAKWDVNIAKLLMTKKNLQFKDKRGYTPLHYIQLYTSENETVYNALIKKNDKLLQTKTNKQKLHKMVEYLVAKRRPKCKNLLNNTIQNQKDFIECFTEAYGLEIETPYLVDKLLAYQPSATQKTLSIIVTTLANDLSNSIHAKVLKKLITSGASTVDVAVPMIIYGGNFVCDSLMLILNNNSKLYDDPRFLKSAPAGENNKYFRREQDLHALSAVGLERGICPEAIQFLAKNHPHLRDVQTQDYKVTPLHIYLGDTHWPDWNFETLKALISKRNINLQDSNGNTPLHNLNNGAGTDAIYEHEIRIIKLMIENGADVSIKNKQGKSVQDLFEGKKHKLEKLFKKYKH